MGIFGNNTRGFTIVELIVVISVIGILISIAVVAWPNYQQRTHDAERKSDLEQLSAAFRTYAISQNDYMTDDSGCGKDGDGNGLINASSTDVTGYQTSIVGCLQTAGVLSSEPFIDPSECVWGSGGTCGSYQGNPVQAYMKATCEKGSNPVTYVFTHLETEPRKDAEIDGLCDSGSVAGFNATEQLWGTNYGMNYYVTVK